MMTNIYAHKSPYELLCVQERCTNIILDGDKSTMERADAQALLDTVNMELTARGRCTCCGLSHNVMECQRVTGMHIEGDDDFDMHAMR